MPIYEYRCTRGHSFDLRQSFSEDPVEVCEVCGAPAQRVLHAPAVHFKGSGFYNTDYGTRKRSREIQANKESAKSEGSGDGKGAETSKAESKAESKTESKSDSGAKSSEAPAKAAKAD